MVQVTGYQINKSIIADTLQNVLRDLSKVFDEQLGAYEGKPVLFTQELQAFLDLLNFYHSFLKDKATITEPLHCLLDKDATWKWTKLHDKNNHFMPLQVLSNSMLVHYNTEKTLLLTCNVSPYGVGTVLSHFQNDGCEAPAAYYS